MSSSAEHAPQPYAAPHVSAEKQVRQQGVRPISSVDELVFPGVWESDEELDEMVSRFAGVVREVAQEALVAA